MGQPRAEYRLSLDRGPQMQNAKPTTRFFFLLTAYCLLATAQPRPRTPVDIRWKKAQKVSLSLTFQRARRDLPVAKLDPQTLSFQADRT